LWKAIDCLWEQVRVLNESQKKDEWIHYSFVLFAQAESPGRIVQPVQVEALVVERLTIVITGLMMRAEAKPKPRRGRNESACGAPVARFVAWVGPFSYECDVQKGLPMPQTSSHCLATEHMMNRWFLRPAVNADCVDL
jgi:hypothetical protein